MRRLGELERAVMDALWRAGRPLTATEIQQALPERDLAVTTVLTVLNRLGRKNLVSRVRCGRAHHYTPTASRDALIAETMLEALRGTEDRGAALARFVEAVEPADAALLRAALAEHDHPPTAGQP